MRRYLKVHSIVPTNPEAPCSLIDGVGEEELSEWNAVTEANQELRE